ncbi:hypothetical protein [Alicyclobacillus acidocaldarius]|uniref:Uncharacterized protein n=1 Tax=Alicyclobacillus acidocaldarius (strain Tc-4-1) TaxID=1048834 RepID=F8IH13_ALIAT|nr:hypothetical protein [Alicyclobacillus acidocaldarius]AEJ44367.1 hypothetical protein TC41_2468 [Alicyclobacillus acidocaldarius subsp. acidocaldarius Tc-4-1]
MICKERLIDALTQTHRALLAYVECVDLCETEEERERLTEIATILAEQARRIQEELLDHVPSKYQA